MAPLHLLDPECVRFLREHRDEIVLFVGAGVSVDAGVPPADRLAPSLAAAASERGAGIEAREDFAGVCADIEATLGTEQLQEVIASVIEALDVQPTPLLRLIARVRTQLVLTSNWDDGVEKSAAEIGLRPRGFEPRMVDALGRPAEDELYVVHVHGMTSEPSSIVMPGKPLDALPKDKAFVTGLRALLAPHTLLYLGYRFPPEDRYLRGELRWLTDNMQGTKDRALLLPAGDYEARAEEWAEFEAAGFRIFTFDSSQGYEAVQQAALILAPQSIITGDAVGRRPDRKPSLYFRPPPIVVDDPEVSREELQTRVEVARAGFGEQPYLEPEALTRLGRAVLIGEAGAGKTELLLRLLGSALQPNHIYLRLPEVAATLLEEDLERAFLRALAASSALQAETPKPTAEAVKGNAYVVLLDAFDEVAAQARASVAERLDGIAARWPQHTFVIGSRPVPELALLPRADWPHYRLLPDPAWGLDYLRETRGIPQSKVDQLLDQFPRASELIAVPLYAALVGEHLSGDEPPPADVLSLITGVAVRNALAREAQREGLHRADLYRLLENLAVAMEISGVNRAPVEALAAIPAPDRLASEETRTHLIQQALLRDLPDAAEFQALSVQEALAAQAILETADPIETLKEVAAAEVAGTLVLRPDIEHTLDLLFESAHTELRSKLREIDQLRWARTQSISIDPSEAADTLRFLWSFFNERRIWVDSDRSRELRDARNAVERLATAFPNALEALRPELVEALESAEETIRGNAVFFLGQLPHDRDRASWLEPRLTDKNSVVRRWAATLARREQITVLWEPLIAAYREEIDELAAGTLGRAVLALAPDGKQAEAALILRANPTGWGRLSFFVRSLPLPSVLALLEQGDLRRWEDERLLKDVLEDHPEGDWSEADVERLTALLVRESSRRAVRIPREDVVTRLAERFPDAALRGAQVGATEETLWADLWFLRTLPREKLEVAANGPLAKAIPQLLERIDFAANQPAPALPPNFEAGHRDEKLADWLASDKLDEQHCVADSSLIDVFSDQIGSLGVEEREQLERYARAWWPQGPLTEAISTDGRHGEHRACFVAALAFYAALDLEIDEQLWLQLFESNAAWFREAATEWIRAHYPGPQVQERVVAHIQSLRDSFLVTLALDALPDMSAEVANAAADALAAIQSEDVTHALSRFREAGQLDALRRLEGEAQTPATQSAARRELAAAGDLDAQRTELEALAVAINAGGDFRLHAPDWLTSVRVEMLDEIEKVLVGLGRRYGPSEADPGRVLERALGRCADERGLLIYDRLMAEEGIIGASFYWHKREALIGQIALARVRERLPDDFPQIIELLEALGYPAREPHD